MEFFRKQPETINFREFMDGTYKVKESSTKIRTILPSGFVLGGTDISFLAIAGGIMLLAVAEKHLADKGYITIAEVFNKIFGTVLAVGLFGGAIYVIALATKTFL